MSSLPKCEGSFELSPQYFASLTLSLDAFNQPLSMIENASDDLVELLSAGLEGKFGSSEKRSSFAGILSGGPFRSRECTLSQSQFFLRVDRASRSSLKSKKIQCDFSFYNVRRERKGLDNLRQEVSNFCLVQLQRFELFQHLGRFGFFSERNVKPGHEIARFAKARQFPFDSVLLSPSRGQTHLPGDIPRSNDDTKEGRHPTYEGLPTPDAVQTDGQCDQPYGQQDGKQQESECEKVKALIHAPNLPRSTQVVEGVAA